MKGLLPSVVAVVCAEADQGVLSICMVPDR